MQKINTFRGVTLIETVLYIALLSGLLALALPLFIDLRAWQSKQERSAETMREYVFINTKIAHVLSEPDARLRYPAISTHESFLSVDTADEGRVEFRVDDAQKLRMDIQERRGRLDNPYSLLSTTSVVDRINFYHSRSENNGPTGIETVQFSVSINGFDFGTSTVVIPTHE